MRQGLLGLLQEGKEQPEGPLEATGPGLPLPLSKVSIKRSDLAAGVEPSGCPVFPKLLPSQSLLKALNYILFYLISKWS